MKRKEPIDTGQGDMFRSRLDQIIDMAHPKVVLAGKIDWQFLSDKCGENYTDRPGHQAREKLVKIARTHDIKLRQSYKRAGKKALIMHQRYAHAKQFKRARRQLRTLKTYLRRTIGDIKRKVVGTVELENTFSPALYQANRVLTQKTRDGGRHIYALYATRG